MTDVPDPSPKASEAKRSPDLPGEVLWVLGGVVILVGAVFMGLKIGDVKDQDAQEHDPLLEVRTRAERLSAAVAQRVPDLLGAGPLGSNDALEESRRELAAVLALAREQAVAIDVSDAEAALVRATFEGSLRRRDWDQASAVVARFAGRPESMVLEARLALARGERPIPEPLKILADAPNPGLAEAARVLLARVIRQDQPEEALLLLKTRVGAARAAAERVGADVFLAVAKLDAERVVELGARLPEGDEGDALRRAASLKAARHGMRLAETRPVPLGRLSDALRIVIQLGFKALRGTEDGERLALAVGRAASELQERAAAPKEVTAYVLLLERLGQAGLRATTSSEVAALADRLAAPEADSTLERLRVRGLVALVRLDVRLLRAHLVGVDTQALEALPREVAASFLRRRVELANGAPGAGAELGKLAEAKELGPVQRARCLLEQARVTSDLGQEAALVRRALTLDPGCPWIRIAFASALAREGKGAESLDEAEGAHVLFDRLARERSSGEEDRLEFLRRLCLVHAERGDEALTEVFLKTLEKQGDPQLADVRARAQQSLKR